jgi:hypothetical protein
LDIAPASPAFTVADSTLPPLPAEVMVPLIVTLFCACTETIGNKKTEINNNLNIA